MRYLLGIDLGTSSVKAVLTDCDGTIKAVSQKEYTFDIPREGWAEQNPEVWWEATAFTIRGVLSKLGEPADCICGIGFSGQMHGLVPLDRENNVVRPAIIWCDHRSVKQVEKINDMIGTERLGQITYNRMTTGFQTASLLWIQENEPALYAKIHTVLLPKDYIRYRLTGELSTDVTDAASTLAFDVPNAKWSDEIIKRLGLRRECYPPVWLPETLAGEVTPAAAKATGLKAGTAVVHGGADQVMQALGNGIIAPGQVSVTIGTGAQVFAPLTRPIYDAQLRSHTFHNFRKDSWYFMGATLSGGLSLRWLRDRVLDGKFSYEEMSALVGKIPPGSAGLVFLPYLSGERTPHMNPYARGMFFGLTLSHGREHMMRAIMEGVVFSLRDCMEIYYGLGEACGTVIASGGGARSAPWLQMQADILNREVYTSQMPEQAGVGAAIAAGVGTGIYQSYEEACARMIRRNNVPCIPNCDNVRRYEDYYGLYRTLYQVNRDCMDQCTGLSLGGE